MKATLKNFRQSPKKVRLVVNLLRGKKLEKAIQLLHGVDKKSSMPIQKFLLSAKSNVEQQGLDASNTQISHISVDEGLKLKRHRARAQGRASGIVKRSCTINLELKQ